MGKKRFTDGLESLLSNPAEELALQGSTVVSVESPNAKSDPFVMPSVVVEKDKKTTHKGFSDNLQSFLIEAFEESFERQMQQDRSTTHQPGEPEVKKRNSKPMDGLDALIRSTVEPRMQFDQNSTRRLTLQFDERKLEKLKNIARVEKTLLRDIIDSIVEEFISRWENQKKQD